MDGYGSGRVNVTFYLQRESHYENEIHIPGSMPKWHKNTKWWFLELFEVTNCSLKTTITDVKERLCFSVI